MTLVLKDDHIEYKGKLLVSYDNFSGADIFWDNVQSTLNAISLDSLFTFKGDKVTILRIL